MDNEIFKDFKFWEDFLDIEIIREINRVEKIENKNKDKDAMIENITNLETYKFENLIFGLIVSICDNMISFGVKKEQIFTIIEPKIKKYKLSPEITENIKILIENRINEETK